MEHIAGAAGVTRGAIYGHFKDKGALFQSMREQVRLPLMDVLNQAMLHSPGDPLAGVERYLLAVVEEPGVGRPVCVPFRARRTAWGLSAEVATVKT